MTLHLTNIVKKQNLRLRIFAGPNGSGKSTVIKSVRNYKIDGKPIDFGIYINADDIARQLKENLFSFTDFEINTNLQEFTFIAFSSGLIGRGFTNENFIQCFSLYNNNITLKNSDANEQLAQIIADFLRKKLLSENKKFSFETVFSHPSKLDIMKQAVDNGYKVYLYFVSTKSPEINKFRVLARKTKGGHDVPPDKIISRYYRSLELLYDATQIAYQAYFWDNSVDGNDAQLFAHFKKTGGKKEWDKIQPLDVPEWFKKYYSAKVKKDIKK